jgi:hypothetical protein
LLILLCVLGLLGKCGQLVVRHFLASGNHAKVHDCLAEDHGGKPPYRRVSCDGGSAKYRVLKVTGLPHTGDSPCLDVASASRSYETTSQHNAKTVCIGAKDADPARSVNIAKEGDCLRVERGVDAERADCADPRTHFRVERRIKGYSAGGLPGLRGPDICASAPGAVAKYLYKWQSEPEPRQSGRTPRGVYYDVVFCLSRVRAPPTAVAGGPVNCRYITGGGLRAAVNAVEPGHTKALRLANITGNMPCRYAVNRADYAYDTVEIEMSGDLTWPPAGGGRGFTIDGVQAAWRETAPGHEGFLSVERPGGRFDVYVSVPSLVPGVAALRDLAAQIYRAAAPHLP